MADNVTADPAASQPDRPVPGPPVIGVTGEVEILHELLRIERARLAMAHQMEVARNIVFPETTVIARDILRLTSMIRAKEEGAGSAEPPDGKAAPPRGPLLRRYDPSQGRRAAAEQSTKGGE